jgi:hypothetical protein
MLLFVISHSIPLHLLRFLCLLSLNCRLLLQIAKKLSITLIIVLLLLSIVLLAINTTTLVLLALFGLASERTVWGRACFILQPCFVPLKLLENHRPVLLQLKRREPHLLQRRELDLNL